MGGLPDRPGQPGAHRKQTNNNDNGTHTVFDYDVQNQYNWTSVTTSYDAQWHQLSQHGVYDNGSVWNI